MRCATYRIDQASLIAALTDPVLLVRYQAQTAEEVKSLADRALIRHLKAIDGLIGRVLVSGFESLARNDLAAADALLSELFAVATWNGWELPIEPLGEEEAAVEGLPRGIFGADGARDNAGLWLLDHRTLALCRDRVAGEDADIDHHKQFHEPGQPCSGGGCGL
jgi:hypothetical protein